MRGRAPGAAPSLSWARRTRPHEARAPMTRAVHPIVSAMLGAAGLAFAGPRDCPFGAHEQIGSAGPGQ